MRRVTSFNAFLPKKRRLPERRGDATQIACENFERKSGAYRNIGGGNATQIAFGKYERKSGVCRNIGGNVTQIAFGKYERKSGVCRNVWEDAKV